MPSPLQFPDDFLWGAATSAHQIEGSPLADGAGASIWTRFAHTPGRVAHGDTGDVACDHYRRWRDDVALMQRLGLQAYRFSLAWGRILPEGTGRVNAAGLDFYERLVDALLAAGIAPSATLYHWDLPVALDDRGGWLNPDSAGWFADYAQVVARRLGDRVALWATLNEPWVVHSLGYVEGVMAPGHRSLPEGPLVAHNLLRAHGLGVQALRTETAKPVGIVVNLEPKIPATDRAEDIAAAARADAYFNRHYLDPLFLGSYPKELAEIYGAGWRDVPADDFVLIQEPIDFLGINYYTRSVLRYDPSVYPDGARRVRQPQAVYTDMDWEVAPDAFTDVLRWVRARYGAFPLYITENGSAFYDPPSPINGEVHDPLRVAYLRDHLRAVHAAIRAGVDIRGYFAWSLLDNFEWAAGYAKRFGLVHVDYTTQQRTPKTSAHVYREVITPNGGTL